MMMQNMFLIENNVPDVYVNESRDFQLVARLYDLILQSTRFSIDSMDYTSDTSKCNNRMLPLVGTKLGFFDTTRLSDAVLRKVLAAFPFIMRYKGSKEGIELVLNLFEQITNTEVILVETEDPSVIIIRFTNYLLDVNLLYQLLEYIRPTGLIIKVEYKSNVADKSYYTVKDTVEIYQANYADLRADSESGIVMLDSVGEENNYPTASNIGFTVLTGLTDNNTVEGGNQDE